MKETDRKLHQHFMQTLTQPGANFETLRNAILEVGRRYHVFKIEAEQLGKAAIVKNQRNLGIFEDRGGKQGCLDPYVLTYKYSDVYELNLYFLSTAASFTQDEKEILELYAMDIYFFLLSMQFAIMSAINSHKWAGRAPLAGRRLRCVAGTPLRGRAVPGWKTAWSRSRRRPFQGLRPCSSLRSLR